MKEGVACRLSFRKKDSRDCAGRTDGKEKTMKNSIATNLAHRRLQCLSNFIFRWLCSEIQAEGYKLAYVQGLPLWIKE